MDGRHLRRHSDSVRYTDRIPLREQSVVLAAVARTTAGNEVVCVLPATPGEWRDVVYRFGLGAAVHARPFGSYGGVHGWWNRSGNFRRALASPTGIPIRSALRSQSLRILSGTPADTASQTESDERFSAVHTISFDCLAGRALEAGTPERLSARADTLNTPARLALQPDTYEHFAAGADMLDRLASPALQVSASDLLPAPQARALSRPTRRAFQCAAPVGAAAVADALDHPTLPAFARVPSERFAALNADTVNRLARLALEPQPSERLAACADSLRG